MFYGCTSLKGAIAYDEDKTDVTYANPTTGYFTVKPKFTYTVPSSGVGSFSADVPVKLPEGLTAHYCTTLTTKDGEQAIAVADVDGTVIPASTGILLKGEAGETYTIEASAAAPATITGNQLVAVVEPTHVDQVVGEYTNFALSGGKFVKIKQTTDEKIPANRAYLPILTASLSGSASSILLSWGDDNATGIQALDNLTISQFDNWYDLQGRKIVKSSNSQMRPGLYIVNGKKVVIK